MAQHEELMSACRPVDAGKHARNITLHKAVVAKFGTSIPRLACIEFVKCCPGCIVQTNRIAKVAGFKPIITKGFGKRGQVRAKNRDRRTVDLNSFVCVRTSSMQVDLIDLQSFKDGAFCYLLVYQDHGIKLPILEPLQSKRGAAVAVTLIRIFSLIGPPSILQTDNGREFSNIAGGGKAVPLSDENMEEVISELKQMWPECKLVHGRARNSQSQGGVERLNQTVQRRLAAWMKDSGSKNWSVGCKFVQWALATAYHTGVKHTPYELAFGQKPSCGLSNLPIAPQLLQSLATEQQLAELLNELGLQREFEETDEVGGHFQEQPPAAAPAAAAGRSCGTWGGNCCCAGSGTCCCAPYCSGGYRSRSA